MPRFAGAMLRTQSDRRLAALAGDGSDQAFEEIVRRHRSELVGVAGQVASASSADDVVQDALIKAHAALRRGDRPDLPRAWLFRIVRNTALNERRGWRWHEQIDENYDGVEQPPEAAERRSRIASLVTAMTELPKSQREAIVQRELEGKGHSEIAASLGLSTGAVRQLIYRARTTLRAGVGAFIPFNIIRMIALASPADPVAAGTAGAGLGIGAAAKIGLGAALTTGAIVTGTNVSVQVTHQTAPPAAEAKVVHGKSFGAGAGVKSGKKPGTDGSRRPRADDKPQDHTGQKPPRDGRDPHDGAPPPADGHQGAPPPPDGSGGGDHHGGGTPPPPDGGGSQPPAP